MNFRALPTVSEYDYLNDAEISAAPNDVFPEQLCTFVFPDPKLKAIFLNYHPDLNTVAFWKQAQRDIHQKVVKHIYPYPQALRFSSPEK
jgi:isocitrate dehydrogenase kinase/phosphatase